MVLVPSVLASPDIGEIRHHEEVISLLRSSLKSSLACFRAWILSTYYPGLILAPDVRIGRRVAFRPRHGAKHGHISVGRGCEIQDGARLETWGGCINILQNTFVGPYAVFYGHGGVHIGRDCLISMHCRILSSNHSVPPIGVPIRSMPDRLAPTIIEDDVWIGAGATILAGVHLHHGAIIGAGAVVAHDIPANAVAVGVPARVIRFRPDSASDEGLN